MSVDRKYGKPLSPGVGHKRAPFTELFWKKDIF